MNKISTLLVAVAVMIPLAEPALIAQNVTAQQSGTANTQQSGNASTTTLPLYEQQAVPAPSNETPTLPAKHHRFKNAMINALHGAGQAGQQYAQQPHQTVTCTTQQLGNTAYTTCQ